ncbi:hypothetical protein D3C78_1686110 [compost metagenome]
MTRMDMNLKRHWLFVQEISFISGLVVMEIVAMTVQILNKPLLIMNLILQLRLLVVYKEKGIGIIKNGTDINIQI